MENSEEPLALLIPHAFCVHSSPSRLPRRPRSQTATVRRSPGAASLLIVELSVAELLAQELRSLSAYVLHCRVRILLEASIAGRWADPTGLAANSHAPSLQRMLVDPEEHATGWPSSKWTSSAPARPPSRCCA